MNSKGYQGRGFQPLSSTEAFVPGTNGNLWYEVAPGPGIREQVDANVWPDNSITIDSFPNVSGLDGRRHTAQGGSRPLPRRALDTTPHHGSY